jgi:hypothetical protein
MLYRVDGGHFKYGQHVTIATTPAEAAQMVLYKGEKYSVWLQTGTVLTVWESDGVIGGERLWNPLRFVVDRGSVRPVEVN